MKLLKTKEIKQAKRNEMAEEISFVNKFRKQSSLEITKFNQKKALIERETKKIEDNFNTFSKKTQDEKNALKNEITILEEKKRVAMIPVNKVFKEAKEVYHKNNEEKDKLENVESDLKVREVIVKEETQLINKRDKKLIKDIKTLKDRNDILLDREKENKRESYTFEKYKTKTSTQLDNESKDLAIREGKLKQQKQAQESLQKQYDKDKVKLEKERIRLNDRQATLERAFKRLKK